MSRALPAPEEMSSLIAPLLAKARVPGGALAVIQRDQPIVAVGIGERDRAGVLPVTSGTSYPIASTSKAINAALIGMLVDEGIVSWDEPVRRHLPDFQLGGADISAQVTLRDLLVMRTGLPRHDWVWIDQSISRAELAHKVRYLDLAAGFREKFIYNNITVTLAGHVAEAAAGQSWEQLVKERILDPLGMRATTFGCPPEGDVTLSYHENHARELRLTERYTTEVAAPSGGAIHSTVEDMARWMRLNLCGREAGGRPLIESATLAEIQAPQVVARTDPSCPSPWATYAMGWFLDRYRGRARLSHGGYLHDVNSEVTLLPDEGIGVVSFINFGFASIARLINERVLDAVLGLPPGQGIEGKLADYEKRIAANRERLDKVPRVAHTSPAHSIDEYVGIYRHPAYGSIRIAQDGAGLVLKRHKLALPLEHWHFDYWVAQEVSGFFIHIPHVFDRSELICFDTGVDGRVAGVSIRLEPLVRPIYFGRLRDG